MIAERVAILLNHYWINDMPDALRARLAADWVNDLAEFPAVVVAGACDEWRRAQTKRPVIADIRALCLQAAPVRQGPALAPPSGRRDDVEKYLAERAESWRKAAEWRNSPEGKKALSAKPVDVPDERWQHATVDEVGLQALLARLEKP